MKRLRNLCWALLVFAISWDVGGLPRPSQAQTTAAEAITIGTTERLSTLDPADANDFFTWEVMTHLFTGLTRQQPGTLDYELGLASDHSVSDDGLTHRFTIRPDAAFSDGTPITAQTFADSIRRNLTLNGRSSGLLRQHLTEVTVDAGANALILTLVKQIPYLWQLVALPPFFPLHPGSFPREALANNPQPLIGNGVYRVERFQPNAALTLTADSAWKGSAPATRTIQLTRFEFPADLRTALVSGEVDLAWRGLPFDDLDMALKSPGVRVERAPGLQTFYLLIAISEEPLDNLSARQGISYMMDRERAVKLGLLETGTALYSLVPEALAANAPTYPAYDYDEAERVLKAGNFTRYRRVEGAALQTSRLLYGELYLSAASTINGNMQRQLAFGFGYFDTEPETFIDQIERGQFRMAYVGWTPLVPHAHAYLHPLLGSDGWLARGAQYRNAEIDTLLTRAALATPAEQGALYREVQALALKDVVVLPLWQGQQSVAVREGIGGVLIEPNFLLRYDQLTKR